MWSGDVNFPPRSPEACWLQRYWVTLAHPPCFTFPSMQNYSVTCLGLGSHLSGLALVPQSALLAWIKSLSKTQGGRSRFLLADNHS